MFFTGLAAASVLTDVPVATTAAARAMCSTYAIAMVSPPAARIADERIAESVEDGIPAPLMRSCHLIVRKSGMHESHEGTLSLFLERHRDHRLFSQGMP